MALVCSLPLPVAAQIFSPIRLRDVPVKAKGEWRRVFVVMTQDHADRIPAGLSAEIRVGSQRVPTLTEFPLPWRDGRLAACVSWRTTDGAASKGDCVLTLRPGRSPPAPGAQGANLWPDPGVDRPIHTGIKNLRTRAWYFGAYGKARGYDRKADVVERAPGEGRSIRVEPSRAGNWYVVFWTRPNFAVEPGREYAFAMRYLTEKDLSGMLQTHYTEGKTARPLRGVKAGLSGKPWVYEATERWRVKRIDFAAPKGAGGVTVHIKVCSPGVLWMKDFAAAPAYEPVFKVTALDQEYGLTDRVARFRVEADLEHEGVVPASEDRIASEIEVWALCQPLEKAAHEIRVQVNEGQKETTPRVTSRGVVEVPLPGKAGVYRARFRLILGDGRCLAEVKRPFVVRANASDIGKPDRKGNAE